MTFEEWLDKFLNDRPLRSYVEDLREAWEAGIQEERKRIVNRLKVKKTLYTEEELKTYFSAVKDWEKENLK